MSTICICSFLFHKFDTKHQINLSKANNKPNRCMFLPNKFIHLLPFNFTTKPTIYPLATCNHHPPIFGNLWGCDFLGNGLNKNKIQSGITRSCPTFGTHVGGSCMWLGSSRSFWVQSSWSRTFPLWTPSWVGYSRRVEEDLCCWNGWDFFILDVFKDFIRVSGEFPGNKKIWECWCRWRLIRLLVK